MLRRFFTEAAKIAGICVLVTLTAIGVIGCRSLTPEDHTRNLKVAVAGGVTACRFYVLRGDLPRDAELTKYCDAIIKVPP